MDSEKNVNKDRNIITILYLIYTFFLYYVLVFKMPDALALSYNGLLYPYEYNHTSAIVSVFVSIVLLLCIRKYYTNLSRVSDITVLLLILLYFIPGLFICSVTEVPKSYLFSYILFIFLFILFDRCIKIGNNRLAKRTSAMKPIYLVYCIFAITIAFVIFFGQEFSLARFLLAVADVYEVRADADYFHWIVFNIEQWAVYFGAVMIVYCLRSDRKKIAWLIVICELFFFSMQANKIDLFVTIMAIICGYIKNLDAKFISFAFVLLSVIIFTESILFDDGIGVLTNIFRRYTVVPNRISTHFFDFFQNHEPDYLRTPFSRVAAFFGESSPYNNIAHLIGNTYYNADMGANTGMMASGLFLFGNLGIIVEAFCIPLFLKLFNIATKGIKSYSINFLIAVVLATLLINSPYPLVSLFWISYFLFLFVSLYICRYQLSFIK